ncbi:TapY2 family type IVa secretion system protein [Shewanella sp. 30m-9]
MKWTSLLTLILASSVQANVPEVKKQDYKCYVETTADHRIEFFHWRIDSVQKRINKLVTMPVYTDNRYARTYIKEVIECAPLDVPFKNAKARALDEITPK